MKVQIIVPGINLWKKYSLPCIQSLQSAMMRAKKHGIDCRLLFIDNASTDETKIEAGKLVSNLFCHQRNEERWGFQKSVNFGVEDAWERGYDFAFICNNDIIVHPEAIWRLVERFKASSDDEKFKNVGMVTCMDVRSETTPDLITSMNAKEKEGVEEAPHPNFSAFMVSRQMWDAVGQFDELYAPAYFEDNDYHYRMDLFGYDAIVHPPALFFHYGSGTQNEADEKGQPIVPGPQFEKNKAAYAKKWGGVPGAETFDRPYDDPKLDASSVSQNP